jgi:hypothetical protein
MFCYRNIYTLYEKTPEDRKIAEMLIEEAYCIDEIQLYKIFF